MQTYQEQRRYSPEEYLQLEETAEYKSEYIDGLIIPMAGGTTNHNRIALNVSTELNFAFKQQDYEVFMGDVRLWIAQHRIYTYPDVMVIVGEPIYWDNRTDTITNPIVIIEVLSESTEQFDRGEKFLRYGNWNPNLTDYMLVSQDKPLIEHYIRQTDGGWTLYRYSGSDADFTIETINCRFKLADIFDRVEFPPEIDE